MEKEHKADVEWLTDIKNERKHAFQNPVVITEQMVNIQCRKVPNWKGAGPDGVQGYWLKNFTSLHGKISVELNDILNSGKPILSWMTYGRTVLCLKDQAKGNAMDNFGPISCLLLM